MSDIDDIIAGGGIVFRKAKTDNGKDGKVKTKSQEKEIYNRRSWQRLGTTESQIPRSTRQPQTQVTAARRGRFVFAVLCLCGISPALLMLLVYVRHFLAF